MKKILYLGTDPAAFQKKEPQAQVTHYPVIQIVPRSVETPEIQEAYEQLEFSTHVIFTSKNAVAVFFEHLAMREQRLPAAVMIAVGQVTAAHLKLRGVKNLYVAEEETQEGVIALLKTLHVSQAAYVFIPQSSLARGALCVFLSAEKIPYRACAIYDTVPEGKEPPPRWQEYDEIVFTSPSTVRAFHSLFGQLPPVKQCKVIGPITEEEFQFLGNAVP